MSATAAEFVDLLLSQDGDRYVFGHEVSMSDSNPNAFDCSEIIEWACARLGVNPTMPDGSWYQARHCLSHHTLVPVEVGIRTAGALLFRFSSTPFSGPRPTSAHVAVSQGNGRTIEARSTRFGVGQFGARDRGWTQAGLVPGLSYAEGDDMNLSKETWQAALDAEVIEGDKVDGAHWYANLANQAAVDHGISEIIRGLILRAGGGGGTVDQVARDRLDKLHTI